MIGLFIQITFVVLKLTHVINWSWWWVLSPLWIGFVIDIISHVVGGIGLGVISSINWFKERRERKRMAHIEDTLEGIQEVGERVPRASEVTNPKEGRRMNFEKWKEEQSKFNEAMEQGLKTKQTASTKRVALCVVGVVLIWIANGLSGMGYDISAIDLTLYDIVAFPLYGVGVWLAIYGSYLWAKDKARSGWWSLMGLIAPIGYLVLMNLKDKRVDEKETTGKALGEIETDFKEITSTQVKDLGHHDVQ